MKTAVKFIIVFIFLGAFSISSIAQDFVFKTYSLNDNLLSQKLDKDMTTGKTPVGINVLSNTLKVMYLNQPLFDMQAWAINWYGNAKEISAGITSKMQNEGFFPMGIASDNSKLYCLYIKGNTDATAWQLVESNQNLSEVTKNISPYLAQGYIPVGITLHGNVYYALLVKVTSTTAKNWEIQGYQGEYAMTKDINQKITQSKVPFGFLEKNGVFNVLYLHF